MNPALAPAPAGRAAAIEAQHMPPGAKKAQDEHRVAAWRALPLAERPRPVGLIIRVTTRRLTTLRASSHKPQVVVVRVEQWVAPPERLHRKGAQGWFRDIPPGSAYDTAVGAALSSVGPRYFDRYPDGEWTGLVAGPAFCGNPLRLFGHHLLVMAEPLAPEFQD